MAGVCDPLDVYCERPQPGDKGIMEFYANNTGIPGPLARKRKPTPANRKPPAFRDVFDQTEYIDYAYPELRQMRGAPYMRGQSIQQYRSVPRRADVRHPDVDTQGEVRVWCLAVEKI